MRYKPGRTRSRSAPAPAGDRPGSAARAGGRRDVFTGIVSDIGTVKAVRPGGDTRFEIATAYDLATVAIGASIACAGCCLTAVEKGPDRFAVQASAETLSRTTLGGWRAGTRVNLERALRMGDELGGHLVLGHVDAVGTVVSVAPEGDSLRIVFSAPASVARFLAPKGSVAIDGVSLTINEVSDENGGGARFGINLIPHTRSATTLGGLAAGEPVNLEIDPVARYVARLLGKG